MGTILNQYIEQDREWHAIADELVAASAGKTVTAWDVTEAQRVRLEARGQVPVDFDALQAELMASRAEESSATLGIPLSECSKFSVTSPGFRTP